MTTYKFDQPTHPLHGREFPEYTKFARYTGMIEYVPLLIGDKQVKFFALCNLREVRVPNMTDLDYIYPQPLAPVQGCALPPYMVDNILALTEILNSRPQERQASRDLYVYELGYKIADALAA